MWAPNDFQSLFKYGRPSVLLKAIKEVFDINYTVFEVRDHLKRSKPITVTRATDIPIEKRLGPRFFACLRLLPGVRITVNESTRSIRNSCYGFRDFYTQDRLYVRARGDTIELFHVSRIGYKIGFRFFLSDHRDLNTKNPKDLKKILSYYHPKKSTCPSVVRQYIIDERKLRELKRKIVRIIAPDLARMDVIKEPSCKSQEKSIP